MIFQSNKFLQTLNRNFFLVLIKSNYNIYYRVKKKITYKSIIALLNKNIDK